MESLGLDMDWRLLLSVFIKIGISFLLASPMAWEREIESHSLGIRTFPLVAVTTCGNTRPQTMSGAATMLYAAARFSPVS